MYARIFKAATNPTLKKCLKIFTIASAGGAGNQFGKNSAQFIWNKTTERLSLPSVGTQSEQTQEVKLTKL